MNINRRSFLKLAAVSGAAAALPIAFVEGSIKSERNAARHIGSVREMIVYDISKMQTIASYDVVCLDRGKQAQYQVACVVEPGTIEEAREIAIKELYRGMMADNIDFSTLSVPPINIHENARIIN